MKTSFNKEKFKKESIHAVHQFVKGLKNINHFVAIFISGSIARGNFLPGSDIDLFTIYKENYASKYKKYHMKHCLYKNHHFSVGYFGRKEFIQYLKKKEETVLSSLIYNPLIIYDPANFLPPLIKKVKRIKLLTSTEKKRKIKRTYNLLNEYLKNAEGACQIENYKHAVYVLRRTLDFILERKRLFCNDPLYDHFKTALTFLHKNYKRGNGFYKIFNEINLKCNKNKLRYYLNELKKIIKKRGLF